MFNIAKTFVKYIPLHMKLKKKTLKKTKNKTKTNKKNREDDENIRKTRKQMLF